MTNGSNLHYVLWDNSLRSDPVRLFTYVCNAHICTFYLRLLHTMIQFSSLSKIKFEIELHDLYAVRELMVKK